MPEFLEDPSVLTKEKLKSELVANSVALPAGEQRKDVYVQLYLQHLTARNRPPAAGANSKGPPDFSSDEEREPTPVLGAAAGRSRAAAGRKATKKTDKPRLEDKDDLDVTELTNEDLLDQLMKYGVNPGPIVGTTRKLYEKKLLKLREQGTESRSSTPLPAISSAENARQNGSNDSDRYSDNEEGKKKEHKKVKSARDFVPFSELPTTPSGGFFQGISFPDISPRPPLGRTEGQAAQRVRPAEGESSRQPLTAATRPARGRAQTLASSGSSLDRCLEKSSSASSQRELAAMLVSAAAAPSLIKETTAAPYKDVVGSVFWGEEGASQPACPEGAPRPGQSGLCGERQALGERWPVISPPLAQAIRDYVGSLLAQHGVGSEPGAAGAGPALDLPGARGRSDRSSSREAQSLSPPRKCRRLGDGSPEEQGSGSFVASREMPGAEPVAPLARAVVAHSLAALGLDGPEGTPRDSAAPELAFPLHESIVRAVEEEWRRLDGQLPSLAHKYPVSSGEAARILAVPGVDEEVRGLVSEAAPPAGAQAASPESCDGQVDLALCRAHEAAASALRAATHAAFVARALQADISWAARSLGAEPGARHPALGVLSSAYDAAAFLCDAAFDQARMAARAMGCSAAGRRRLWLRDCPVPAAAKSQLATAPFRGGTLFAGEVHRVTRKRAGKR